MTEVELRAHATTATEAKFRDKPFDWTKQATCIHLMRFHASQMGHDLQIVPRFRSPLGAKKALKAMGHDDLIGLMDSLFPAIPPAFARTGDIVAAEGCDMFHGLMVRGGNTMFLGWHEAAVGCTIIDVDMRQLVGAWRL